MKYDFNDLGLHGKIISSAIKPYIKHGPIKPYIKHGPKPLKDVEKLAKKSGICVVTCETTKGWNFSLGFSTHRKINHFEHLRQN